MNVSREVAAECAQKIGEFCRSLGESLEDDPRLSDALSGKADPVTMGLLLLLANSVMDDANWSERHHLFDGYGKTHWPDCITVRQRINELLDGVGLRADYWNLN